MDNVKVFADKRTDGHMDELKLYAPDLSMRGQIKNYVLIRQCTCIIYDLTKYLFSYVHKELVSYFVCFKRHFQT